jgi:hypothetical protein
MVDVNEPINVWVYFKGTTIQPFAFFWKSRQIKIETVNLMYESKHDGTVFYCFAVSSGGNYYKLRFDLRKLRWFMDEVEEG